MHLKHKFLPLHSAPTPGGPSPPFSLISTQCHALSTYSMCPFHTNSSQKWSSDGAQLGPRGCYLIDERQGGQVGRKGWRKWKSPGTWRRKIRYGETQAGKPGMAIAALMSISGTAVDPSMQNKMLSKQSSSLRCTHQSTPHSTSTLTHSAVTSAGLRFGSHPASSSTFLPALCEGSKPD